MRKLSPRRIVALIAFPLLVAALVVPVVIWRQQIWNVFASVKNLRQWVEGWGPGAPFVFIGVQAIQVIVFVIPGEVAQIAGGFLFGGWMGILLSVVGIAIGSTIAFFASRLLGKPFVGALFAKESLERTEKMLSAPGAKIIFFLLFLIPGIPKDILCYVAGISPLRYRFFIAASMLARLPGLVGSTMIGRAAAANRWVLLGILSALSIVVFVLGLVFRPRIQSWIEKLAEKRHASKGS
jgi:uncharacterized membrane protein YdjX (TVP38/TMEM64 family)